MKYKTKDIEFVLDTIKDEILLKYQDYDKYNEFNINLLFNDYRARILAKLIKNNDKHLKEYIQYYSKSDLLEMMIYYFFNDIPYNFLINLKEIMNYMKLNKNYKPYNLELYKKILNFDQLSIQEIKELFDKYKRKKCTFIFYRDYRRARDLAYQDINNHLLDFNTNINYLDGQDFYLCIYATNNDIWDNNNDSIPLNLISHNNMDYFINYYKNYIFGFSKLKVNHIMHVYQADSHYIYPYGTDKVQRIITPEQLIKQTDEYNTIFYKLDSSIKPDLIICFDNVNSEIIQLSRENKLKVVIINSDKYKNNKATQKVLINNYITHMSYEQLLNYEVLEDIKR